MKYNLVIVLVICFNGILVGQLTPTGNKAKIDSLLHLVKTQVEDTNQVNNLNLLGFEISIQNFSNAKIYLNKAEKLARKLQYKKGIANALSYLGIAYETQGNYFEALNAQISALKIREEIGDKSGISYSIHYIGDIYFGLSDLSEKKSTKEDYNNKALDKFFESLKIAEEINDVKSIANTYNCIGNSLREQENYQSALDYYLKTVKIREEIGDTMNLSTTYVNIGKLYLKQEKFDEALENLLKALSIAEASGHKRTTVKALGTIGTIYFLQNDYDKSIEFCTKSLLLGKEIGYLEYIAKANKTLSQIYSTNDFKGHDGDKALMYYKAYILEKDSIDSKKANQVELQFDFDKKTELAKAEHTKQLALAEEERKRQELILWSTISGLVLVLLFSVLIFRSLRITRKQKSIIEQKEKETHLQNEIIKHKQKEIIDSMNYAKRIQEAQLPNNKQLDRIFGKLKKS